MSILTLVVLVVIICLIVWLVQSWGLPQPFRNIVYALTLLLLVLLVLNLLGLLGGTPRLR